MMWFAIGVVSGLLFSLAITAFISPRISPPPLEWVLDTYDPVVACPGDQIDYTLGILIKRPGSLYVVDSINRSDESSSVVAVSQSPVAVSLANKYNAPIVGDTVQFRRWGEIAVLVVAEEQFEDSDQVLRIDLDSSFTVPDLPPGKYSRVLAAGPVSIPAREAIRSQDFEIMEGCK